jgi:phage terminase large subunit-like protein
MAGLVRAFFDLEMEAQVLGPQRKSKRASVGNRYENVHRKSSGESCFKKWGLLPSKNNGFKNTGSTMMPLWRFKTQDGINCHVGIIDEYHKAWQR